MARAKKPAARKPADGMTTYMLETKNGNQKKLTIPSNWKLTFGPTVPYERKSGGYDGGWALRMYDGAMLKGIFTDVKNFRDMSIELLEKQVRIKRQRMEQGDKAGGKEVIAEARWEEWVDPDAPDEARSPEERGYTSLTYDGNED